MRADCQGKRAQSAGRRFRTIKGPVLRSRSGWRIPRLTNAVVGDRCLPAYWSQINGWNNVGAENRHKLTDEWMMAGANREKAGFLKTDVNRPDGVGSAPGASKAAGKAWGGRTTLDA